MFQTLSSVQKATFLSILGTFLFSVGDILRKFVLQDHSAPEVQLWASTASVIAIILVSKKLGGIKSLKTISKPHIHFVKSVLVTLIMGCAVMALERLSLDVFYTLIFTIPMITSILAAIFFKEPLSLYKALIICMGFVGVLVIIRPDGDIDLFGVVLTMLLAFSFSLNSILNKCFSPDEAKFPFGFLPYALSALVFLIINKGVFVDIGYINIILCAIAGTVSVFAMVILVYAYQTAKASVAAPYQYTQLIWGVIAGIILFNDVPDIWVLLGALIIITAGVILYKLETRKNA